MFSSGVVRKDFMALFFLGILSVPASAEKGTLESGWIKALNNHRERLNDFELWTETWRYEIFDTTAPISIARTEEWVQSLNRKIQSTTCADETGSATFSLLVDQTRAFFESPPDSAEVLSELHRRRANQGLYWVWERRTGALSKYEREGTWHQSDGLISMGPPVPEDSIEVFLSCLGLMIPKQAKALTIPEATPENPEEWSVFQVDTQDFRYRLGGRPWNPNGLSPLYMEEYPLVGGEEGNLTEKRYFFRFPCPETDREINLPLPNAALEFRFGFHGELTSYALIQIHPIKTDPTQWRPFPSSRPPFGWKVLDYRFLPEKEYTFGEIQ